MGKCLKCSVYKLWQFGRRVIAKNKIAKSDQSEQSDESENESKYNKKVKLIFGKDKII